MLGVWMKGRKLFGDERVFAGDKRSDRIINLIVKPQQANVCPRVTLPGDVFEQINTENDQTDYDQEKHQR